jgi:broad specificity phosphatase PhoE
MRESILVRHAESVLSAEGNVNGDPEIAVPLTDIGRAQARALGEILRNETIDLCVTSAMERSRETADVALEGRSIPRLELPELSDIRFGRFEGGPLSQYRAWASAHDPALPAPGGGESRVDTVRRYVKGFREILVRPEEVILVVAHGLPIRYVLNAVADQNPVPLVEQVRYAEAHRLDRKQLESAVERLDRWAAHPIWA